MALVESRMLELGVAAPDFRLPEVTTSETLTLDEASGEKGVLVMFICSHCPFVVHVQQELARIGRDYADRAIGIVAVCANDVGSHPQDAPDKLAAQAAAFDFRFPYLHDATQEVAKAYGAVCTPDFFLFDGERKLVYRGQLDGSRPGNEVAVSGADLRAALDALLADQPVSQEQTASIGCNIKWRAGNEPG